MVVKKTVANKKQNEDSDHFTLVLESALDSENFSEEEANEGISGDKKIQSSTPKPVQQSKSVSASSKIKEKAKETTINKKSHPSTLIMICEAVNDIDEKKGASVQAIRKWILHKYADVDPGRLKNSMKLSLEKGLSKGVLTRPKTSNQLVGAVGRFLVATKNSKPKTLKRKVTKVSENSEGTDSKLKVRKTIKPKEAKKETATKSKSPKPKPKSPKQKPKSPKQKPKSPVIKEKSGDGQKADVPSTSKDVKVKNKPKPKSQVVKRIQTRSKIPKLSPSVPKKTLVKKTKKAPK